VIIPERQSTTLDDSSVLARAGVIPQAHPPYRPQYNGNVERLNLTLDREWAYARSYTSN